MAENTKPAQPGLAVASAQVAVPRMSFASVAARAPQQQEQGRPSNKVEDSAQAPTNLKNGLVARRDPSGNVAGSASRADDGSKLQNSLSRLDIGERHPPIIASGDSDHDLRRTLQCESRQDDEKTQLSFISHIAPSLDGKSVASVTTFAMDEKESIRPDDSASVKAGEDDDSNSGPASGAANSRVGSEAGSKAFREQFYEVSGAQRALPPLARRLVPGIPEEAGRSQTINGPSLSSVDPGRPGAPSGPAFFHALKEPDEKLVEAMQSPKDRLFLLQLEQDVICMIRDPNRAKLEVPPCNSFCRLLAHRLGDYYALTHLVDSSVNTVTLYKTSITQLRPTLSEYTDGLSANNGVPSNPAAMKIMRRTFGGALAQSNGLGLDMAAHSLTTSKTSSEAGEDGQKVSGIASPTESTIARDKAAMTREEREAKYKETRERIFKGFEEGENAETNPSTETSNGASRASSTCGKKKKKNRNNNSESLDSRFAYNYSFTRQGPLYDPATASMNYYPYVQHSDAQTTQPNMQQGYMQQPYQNTHMYQMPIPPPASMLVGPVSYPQGNAMPNCMAYPQMQQQQQYYPQMSQQSPMMPRQSPIPSPAISNHSAQLARPTSQMSDQGWNLGGYQSPYQMLSPPSTYQAQNQPAPQGYMHGMQPAMMPYQYSQATYQQSSSAGRPPHPMPGSYTRQHGFNPQTQAFVPGSGSGYMSPAGAYAPQPGPGMAFSAQPSYQQHQMPMPMPQMSSGRSVPSYPSYTSTPRKPSSQTTRSQSPAQSTLSKWGTPSTLPPKPPPPASSNASVKSMGPPGPGMPTFQNGTYSKPGNT